MSIADLVIAMDLLNKKGGSSTDLNGYILKKLIKKMEAKPDDKKKEDDKKKSEWTVQERLLLGIFLTACAPLVGAAYAALFEYVTHAH